MPCSALTLPRQPEDELEDGRVGSLFVGRGSENVDVQVAVGNVAVRDRERTRGDRRNRLGCLLHQLRVAGHRHGHVQLVRHAFRIDGLCVPLAELPQPMAAGGIDGQGR